MAYRILLHIRGKYIIKEIIAKKGMDFGKVLLRRDNS